MRDEATQKRYADFIQTRLAPANPPTTASRRRCAGIPCSSPVTAPCGGARFKRAMPSGLSEAKRLRESRARLRVPVARHSLALGLVASPWVATTLKGRLRRDCLAKWECARAEGVGLGEREARTAKQPQGPAKVPRGVEIPAGRRNRRVSGVATHRDSAKPSGLSVAKRLRESRAGHRRFPHGVDRAGDGGEKAYRQRKNDVETKPRLICGVNNFTNICKIILRSIDGEAANMIY